MNDRDDIRDDLSALIDGALDPDRQPEVEAALDTDPALRAEYDRLSGIDALYAALPREAVPEGFAQSVRDAIARRENIAAAEPTQRPVKLRMFTQATRRSVFWPVAAAATLLVGFFLWSTVNRANQANTLLTVAKSVPAKAADAVDGKEQLYKVRVMPEEKGKAEAPAAAPVAATSTHAAPSPGAPAAQEPPAPPAAAPAPPAPAPEAPPDTADKEAKGQVLMEQQPPSADDLPALQPLSKEDRERALRRMLAAKKTAPAPQEGAVAAAPPADATNAPAPPTSATEAPAAGAGPQAAAPAPTPANTAEQRKVAGRVFLRTDSGWVDHAYKGEVLTPLEESSDEFKQLLPTHPPLEKVAELGGSITLRIDGVWRDLKTTRPLAEPK